MDGLFPKERKTIVSQHADVQEDEEHGGMGFMDDDIANELDEEAQWFYAKEFGSLLHVFECLDTDRSGLLDPSEQRVVWDMFGVGSAYQPKPSVTSTQFVDWIVETANALTWRKFEQGYLRMLQHALNLSASRANPVTATSLGNSQQPFNATGYAHRCTTNMAHIGAFASRMCAVIRSAGGGDHGWIDVVLLLCALCPQARLGSVQLLLGLCDSWGDGRIDCKLLTFVLNSVSVCWHQLSAELHAGRRRNGNHFSSGAGLPVRRQWGSTH